ncbi:GIY-YIG nuclease family protein [Janibacter sp. DB-40]|uniref:GIY-YIG nuclease family protein n=1 Tax=Janibacter sp. DB-40 TaxID=3028808 RepID=UPI002405AB52|nr:GIY-YIG nuclease family protein [Janibacter sp. DB-40]
MVGKQLRLFLVDGTAGGLITAEIVNWTGHVLKGSREKLGEIRRRAESHRTGVYILLGEDPDSGGRLAYVGQSDDVAKRLQHHDIQKDFWTDVAIVTSKDMNLTSAHVRYLEARLVRLAKAIGRVPLENGNEPTGGADLPEADASDMEYFIEQLRVVLPVLGVDVFRGRETRTPQVGAPPAAAGSPAQAAPTESPTFYLRQASKGVDAKAQVIDGEFTVLAGSRVRAVMPDRDDYSPSSARQYELRQSQHGQLVQDGSIEAGSDGSGSLTRDVAFSSPSAAGAICLGTVSINGRVAWTREDGATYAAWEGGHQLSTGDGG